jgi:hypothetical protein
MKFVAAYLSDMLNGVFMYGYGLSFVVGLVCGPYLCGLRAWAMHHGL